MKAVTKELNTDQHHQATQTLVRIGLALSQIRLQRRFKNIVLLGGVEQALIAMRKATQDRRPLPSYMYLYTTLHTLHFLFIDN